MGQNVVLKIGGFKSKPKAQKDIIGKSRKQHGRFATNGSILNGKSYKGEIIR